MMPVILICAYAGVPFLSRELARRGHRVEVYNACWAPGEYDGVLWKGAWDIDSASGTALFTSNHIWRRAFKPLFGIEE